MPLSGVERVLAEALAEAEARGVRGKAVTPNWPWPTASGRGEFALVILAPVSASFSA